MVQEKNAGDSGILDEDNEQSQPLLGDDYGARNGDHGDDASVAKLAEYLPAPLAKQSFVYRVLRGLYGHLPREDVPRVIWVRSVGPKGTPVCDGCGGCGSATQPVESFNCSVSSWGCGIRKV